MSSRRFPGRLTERLLTLLLKNARRDEIIGDLIEDARSRVLPRRGRLGAQLWLLREAAKSMRDLSTVRGLRWPGIAAAFVSDSRFALRTLRKRPLFALLAVTTLGLGIGASTAMFSVVDGVLIKPLPYYEPERLVTLWSVHRHWQGMPEIGGRWDRGLIKFREYRVWRDENTLFESVAIYRKTLRANTGRGPATLLPVGEASASLLPTLGVAMHTGRWFSVDEEAVVDPTAARVAVLSHDLWQRAFGADDEILGTGITLDGQPHTIVGVLPANFRLRFLEGSDLEQQAVWVPISGSYFPGSGAETSSDWEAIGRLAPGVSIERAAAETVPLLRGDRDPARYDFRLDARTGGEARGLTSPLVLLLGASAVLLLIGCGNVSLLLLGEMDGREHELATRVAVGAGRGRIIRQLVSESAVLGLAGSAAGGLIALLGVRALLRLAPAVPRLDEVTIDYRVLAFCAVLGIATGLIFGVGPAVAQSRRDPAAALNRSKQGSGRHGRLLTQGVVSGQIGLTVVLLVLGGLLARSFERLVSTDPGFEPEGIASVKVTVPRFKYRSADAVVQFVSEARRVIAGIPGVRSVGAIYPLPFSGDAMSRTMRVDPDRAGGGRRVEVMLSYVLPGYRAALELPLLEGRDLTVHDDRGTPPVAVVNQSFAAQHWPGESSVGRVISNPGGIHRLTVVGVVGDFVRESLAAPAEPTFFVSLTQSIWPQFNLVARTDRNASELVGNMMRVISTVDPHVPLSEGVTVSALVARSTRAQRFGALLMVCFGAVATVLAASGVFGLTARHVSHRRREIGVRMALGANPTDLIAGVVARNGYVAVASTAVGLLVAWWSTRLIAGFMFEYHHFDPLVSAAVAGLLCGTCLVASLIPARRITGVDPVTVLRAE
ncbi:MAG: ABC transporter permease [Gemmatimonadota bacterium]|nr:MAG: ABC transporter permease [Gemmatimonadota bacterium]